MDRRSSMGDDWSGDDPGINPDGLHLEAPHPVLPRMRTQVLPLPIQGAKRGKPKSVARRLKGGTKASW
jgi:hypothetical protein